jgi:hypothetical protein
VARVWAVDGWSKLCCDAELSLRVPRQGREAQAGAIVGGGAKWDHGQTQAGVQEGLEGGPGRGGEPRWVEEAWLRCVWLCGCVESAPSGWWGGWDGLEEGGGVASLCWRWAE